MSTELEKYLKKRPKWLQSAAANLLEKQIAPTEVELNKFADLCVAESNGQASDSFSEIPNGALSAGDTGVNLRIQRVENPVGINALSSKSYLDAESADIFLVYGPNGSGKSSYARLLKKACGIKSEQVLQTNIFDSGNETQSATIIYKNDEQTFSTDWNASKKSIQELAPVSIFDPEIARSYVASSTEAAREPFSLRFISRLISICDSVRTILNTRKKILPTQLPIMPDVHKETVSYAFYNSLREKTSSVDISKHCSWQSVDINRKAILVKSLGAEDPSKLLNQLNKDKVSLDRLKIYWKSICDAYSTDHLTSILKTQKERDATRKIADAAATKVFSGAIVDGVGSDSWKALWAAAKLFSETEAYPNQKFPHTDGYCVLCHQVFDKDDDKLRANNFEEFITGQLETAAIKAEVIYQKMLNDLPEIDATNDWSDRFSKLPIDGEPLETTRLSLSEISKKLTSYKNVTDIPVFSGTQLSELIEETLSNLNQEIEVLGKTLQDDTRSKLESELKELNAKEWVTSQKSTIQLEISRLQKIKQLDNALATTDTSLLTIQKKKLAKSDLIDEYKMRFDRELEYLGGSNIKAAPSGDSAGKGKILFNMKMVGTSKSEKTTGILSDGESRVVALSSFLADMSIKSSNTPFIFDDPITSLDQDYEEKVVNRLVSLSKERQVIIFTHRLSLKTLVEESVKKESNKDSSLGTDLAPNLKISTLRTVAGTVGVVTESTITEKTLKSAINTIYTRSTELKKTDATNNYEDYSHRLMAICSNFRVLVERTIEEHLFNNVVRRFRRSVITKDKLSKLSMITLDDAKLLDNLMTQFSVFEHSQSVELPMKLPEIEDVISDIESLRSWIKEFGSRSL